MKRPRRGSGPWTRIPAAGVGWMLAGVGRLPWVALALAATFGSYGLARKLTPVAAAPGLFVETLLLAPLAAGFLLWLGDEGAFGHVSRASDGLLAAAGLVTAVPLMTHRPSSSVPWWM